MVPGFRDAAEVLQDAVCLADQLEEIRLENDIVPEDTMILFSNAGGYLVSFIRGIFRQTNKIHYRLLIRSRDSHLLDSRMQFSG